MDIKKVAVIGAGVMGRGIAAQVANSSHRVVLLDLPAKDDDKNSGIKAAMVKMNEGKSPALTHPTRQEFIQIGNIEDDLKLLSDCDLVIEAIIEKIEIKHQLYAKIIPYLKNEAIIASNTSTLPLRDLKNNLPNTVKPHFVITHFFNPPRTMELLELVTDNDTSLEIKKCVTNFITHALGKTVIDCNDTPGFIANRLGCYLLELTVRKGIELGLKPNIIDQIFTDLFRLPSTSIFGLYDLIGLDVMQLISSSLVSRLPQDDDYYHIYTKCNSLEQMIKAGLIGKKTKAGFYKSIQQDNVRISQIIDLNDLSYKSYHKKVLFKDIDELLESDNEYATFIKDVLLRFYTYILKSCTQITDNPKNIDLAMKLGYSWNYGPFELLYNIPSIAKFIENKIKEPIHEKIAQTTKPKEKQIDDKTIILSNTDAQLINISGRLIFTLTTKMNCLTIEVFELLSRAIHYAEQNNSALYILSPGNNFSPGADLKYILHLIENKNFADIDKFLKIGQQTLKALKYANIKVIVGACGYALGGGTEILLHSHFLVLNQELKAGLVESAIGLIPAFGGTKEMLMRGRSNSKVLIKNIENIIKANKSSSADYFIHDYSIDSYKININKHYLLYEAASAESKIEIKSEKMDGTLILPKIDLASVLEVSKFNSLQKEIMSWLQNIIDTDSLTEDDLLDHERDKFIELCQRPYCQQVIKSKL